MAEPARHCECGCGKLVKGPRTKRYYDSTHAKRAQRAARADAGQVDGRSLAGRLPSPNGDGKVRPALERWLKEQCGLPEPLVAAARALSDQVDRTPTNSPLWGRLSTVLTELVTPQVQAQQMAAEMAEIHRELSEPAGAEAYRMQRLEQARANGEDTRRWGRLCPIGCLQGDHRWHQWGGPDSRRTCLDCYGSLEDDGTVSWPDWLAPKPGTNDER
jgi:hypothetical protein